MSIIGMSFHMAGGRSITEHAYIWAVVNLAHLEGEFSPAVQSGTVHRFVTTFAVSEALV